MAFKKEIFEQLSAPFDNISERKGHKTKDGEISVYRYVPITDIIKRLNSVFGLNWNYEIIREEIHWDNEKAEGTKNSTTVKTKELPVYESIEKPDESQEVAKGKQSIVETTHRSDSFSKQRPKSITTLCRLSVVDDDGIKWIKEAWGGQEVKYFGEATGGGVLNITNDKKGAASDALKKAAELMGIALDVDALSESHQHSEIISLLKQLGATQALPAEVLQSMSFYDARKMIKQLKEKAEEL